MRLSNNRNNNTKSFILPPLWLGSVFFFHSSRTKLKPNTSYNSNNRNNNKNNENANWIKFNSIKNCLQIEIGTSFVAIVLEWRFT